MLNIDALESTKETKFNHEIARLRHSVNLLEVPPNLTVLDNYRTATSTGLVDVDSGPLTREPISLMYLDNQPLKLSTPVERFSQMGYGYSYLFYQGKFVIILAIFPLLFYGITMMSLFSTGKYCIHADKYIEIRKNVTSYKDIEILKEAFPNYRMLDRLQRYHDNPQPNLVMRKFISLNCFLNDTKETCQYLKANRCEKEYTKACEYRTIDLYVDNYVNQIAPPTSSPDYPTAIY